MANRILRDWTDSETIEQLSWEAEVFFTRLCMKADDFGYYHANIKLLKSALFPLREISLKEVQQLVDECEKIGLIQLYEANKKPYLFIPKFGQRLRIMQSRFPQPGNTMQVNDSVMLSEEKGSEDEAKNFRINMVEQWIKDLPNDSDLEDMCRINGLNKDYLLSRINDFKQKADPSYQNKLKFLTHFRNWVDKNPVQNTSPKKRNTII